MEEQTRLGLIAAAPSKVNEAGKAFATEGGLRVPMIIQWPGKIESGSETDHISAFYDVLPTFSELTGAELKDPVDGISFLPEVMGKTDQAKHDFLYWEFPHRAVNKLFEWENGKASVGIFSRIACRSICTIWKKIFRS